MNRYVFSVGSAGGKPLEATKKDAASLYTIFIANAVGNCHQSSPQPLLGCRSIEDFNSELNDLLRRWKKEDQLIFYYSGHGRIFKNKYCLVLGDSNVDLLPFDSFSDRLEISGVEKAIIILDACAAGEATKGAGDIVEGIGLNPVLDETRLPDGMAIIASSGPAQFSWQNSTGDASVFTEVLLGILRNGILNGSEFIYVDDVVDKIVETLSSNPEYAEFQQEPVFSFRGRERIWIARNIAYADSGELDKGIGAEIYSATDLELLAVEKLSEEHPSKIESLEEIDWALVSKYRDAADGLDGSDSQLPASESDLLRLGLLSPISLNSRRVPHRSAAMCFCTRPDRFHPEALTIYLDMTLDNSAFVRKEILGPLVKQLTTLQELVQTKLNVHSFIDPGGERRERAEVDLELFREVLANAFVHRDFTVPGTIEVRLTDEWLEISNPGGLLNGKEFTEVLDNTYRSVPRNPVLMLLTNRLRRTEQFGRGFKLLRECVRVNGKDSVQCFESTGPITVFRLRRTLQKGIESKIGIAVTPEPSVRHAFLVPRRNSFFQGRDNDLQQLNKKFSNSKSTGELLSGLGGVGKTQIALEYVWKFRENHHSIFWVSAENEETIISGFREIAENLQLSFDADDQQSLITETFSWLKSNNNWLVVFDNANDSKLLDKFIPIDADGRVLITSRIRNFSELGISNPTEIGRLPEDACLKFLEERSGQLIIDNVEKEAAIQLVAEVDGLPLALEQVAAYIKDTGAPYSEYLELYRMHPLEILEKRGPETSRYMQSIASTWSVNMGQLKDVQRDIIYLSAFLSPSGIPFEVIEVDKNIFDQELANNSTRTSVVRELLEPLKRFSLVEIDSVANEFNVHSLVQVVAQNRLTPSEREHWLNRAVINFTNIFPDPNKVKNWPVCERFVSHIVEIFQHLNAFESQSVEAGRLLAVAGKYLSLRGNYRLAEPLILSASTIFQSELSAEDPLFTKSMDSLAALYRATGRYNEAEPILRKALEIRLDLSLEASEEVFTEAQLDIASNYNNLAANMYAQGKYDEAETLFLRVLEIRNEVLGHDHLDTATSMSNLAAVHSAQGRYVEAEKLLSVVLGIYGKELGDMHPNTARSMNNLAEVHRSHGLYEEAKTLLIGALDIYKNTIGEEHPDTAKAMNNLAGVYGGEGEFNQARLLFIDSLSIRKKVLGEKHPDTAASMINLGALYKTVGHIDEAQELISGAVAIYREALGSDHPETAKSILELANVYETKGRFDEARSLKLEGFKTYAKALGEKHPDTVGSGSLLKELDAWLEESEKSDTTTTDQNNL